MYNDHVQRQSDDKKIEKIEERMGTMLNEGTEMRTLITTYQKGSEMVKR